MRQASAERRRPRRPGFPNSLYVLRLLVFISDIFSPGTKTMDEKWDVRNDYKDGNEGLIDPGQRGRRRTGES